MVEAEFRRRRRAADEDARAEHADAVGRLPYDVDDARALQREKDKARKDDAVGIEVADGLRRNCLLVQRLWVREAVVVSMLILSFNSTKVIYTQQCG